ncbi:hypothetical protein CHS0354_007062 [Potamilus streckersoni]|uniref:Uncharacterized protein n=1 Tax=Potamilus streckersoni TaxID=2493646 RepID=A0AAE0VLF1_9BIVA|nr:hypothetical protein CHS0354_007062 [Potamilus streckersoni]
MLSVAQYSVYITAIKKENYFEKSWVISNYDCISTIDKMRFASMTVIILSIILAGTDGRQCWYRFGRCFDRGDQRGKCSDSGGTCYRVTGTQQCRCRSPLNMFGIDVSPGT